MPAPLFVRPLTQWERKKLRYLVKFTRDLSLYRRGWVVLLSARRETVGQIAARLRMHRRYVRRWIKVFNRQGLALWVRQRSPGRSRAFGPEVTTRLKELWQLPPPTLGWRRTNWTLATMAAQLQREGLVDSISLWQVRRLLKKGASARKKPNASCAAKTPKKPRKSPP